jgi:predicted PurR-regulated permease PerM
MALTIAPEVGGVVGALLGIPVAGSLKVVSGELVGWRRGEPAPPAMQRVCREK